MLRECWKLLNLCGSFGGKTLNCLRKHHNPLSLGTSILTLAVAIVAVRVYWAQLAELQKTVDQTQTSLSLTEKSIRANTETSTYAEGNEINKYFGQWPDLREYFEKDDSSEDNFARARVLRNKYPTEKNKTRIRILIGSELIADYEDHAYSIRTTLDPEDWNLWWNSFCDLYDESPFLQDFFDRRDDWYLVAKALRPVPNVKKSSILAVTCVALGSDASLPGSLSIGALASDAKCYSFDPALTRLHRQNAYIGQHHRR